IVVTADDMRRIGRQRASPRRLARGPDRPRMGVVEPARADVVAVAEETGVSGGILDGRGAPILSGAGSRECDEDEGCERQQWPLAGLAQWHTLLRPERLAL